jgi:hypothetical protein
VVKRDELNDPRSCLNKAGETEWLFVLLARDPAAPSAIRAWVAERLRLGANDAGDEQLAEALQVADRMERHHTAPP